MHRLFCGNLSISPLFYNLLKFPRNLDARSSEPPPFPLCNIDSFTLPHPDFVVLLFCNVTQKAEKLIFHLLQVPLLCLEFYHICFKNFITLCTRGKPGYRSCLLNYRYSNSHRSRSHCIRRQPLLLVGAKAAMRLRTQGTI